MIRRMLDDLLWHFRGKKGPGQARYYLRQLTRKPMTYEQLSIDPRGEWSPVKARHVLAIINPEAKSHGIFFDAIDITTYGHAGPRMMLVPYCVEHEIAVDIDTLCPECIRHAKP